MNSLHQSLFLNLDAGSSVKAMSKGLSSVEREDLESDFLKACGNVGYSTILADPPWQFQNRTGKMAPEHHRLNRYSMMSLDDVKSFPVSSAAQANAHLYLWVPSALLREATSRTMPPYWRWMGICECSLDARMPPSGVQMAAAVSSQEVSRARMAGTVE